EGTRFTQFYVASGVCSPSRAAVMTGQFPARLGIHDYIAGAELNRRRGMAGHLDPATPTVTRLLQQAGYATAHFGKWHLGRRKQAPEPTEYGIDRYDSCIRGADGRVRSSERIADETIAFAEANRDRPFFINAWIYDPHSPLHPTEEMMAPYANLTPRWGENKGAMQVYYGVLTNLDRHIGRVLDRLDQLGLSENTVVIFSSDNGPESGLIPFVSHYGGAASAGPFRGLKRSLYEGGVRVPFIVRWPGKTPAGAVDNDTVISGVDFLPTIARLAGVDLPAGIHLDGEDLSAVFRGKPLGKARPLMWENRYPVYGHVLDKSPILAIRDGKWKLLMNPDRSRMELYDIPRDPSELNNLARERPEVVARLSRPLLDWQATLPKGPVDPDAGKNSYPWPGR
ncbi:MAG: sulfatase-like hydrolase/transferase, partial [bacterium]|nr:sulfatase-like hydrolase/transferase [bacterium]